MAFPFLSSAQPVKKKANQFQAPAERLVDLHRTIAEVIELATKIGLGLITKSMSKAVIELEPEATTGVLLLKRTAEQIVVEASVDFERFYAQCTAQLDPDSGRLLVAAVDGKGVPMVKPHAETFRVRLNKGEKRN